MKKVNVANLIVLMLKGVLVGFGAIMPGISGGTLCVAFGMYQPIMNLLTHPFQELKKNWLTLMFFIIGGGLGFVGLSGLAGWLMAKNESAVVCAFIGFILGTVPELWHDAGKKGRGKSSYISMAAGFVILLALLIILENSASVKLNADFWSFLLCGVLWGLSFVVPGLSSSTLIMFFGLYQQMLDGISTLSMSVLIPLAIGVAACMLILPRGVNAAFGKWYSQLSHAIIGVVLASTVMVIPEGAFGSVKSALISIAFIIAGAVVSFLLSRLCAKLAPEEVK